MGTYLERAKKEAARCSVLRLFADHMSGDITTEELGSLVEQARKRFSVFKVNPGGEAFEDAALCEIYVQFLNMLLDGPENDANDLPALRRLRAALDLDGIVVGAAHKRVAQLLVSRGYSGLEGEAMRVAVDKFLFLSERAFADEEPEEARKYEMGRLLSLLNISEKEARPRVAAVSQALYRQSLNSITDHVDTQTGEVLTGASAAFGIAGDQAARMNTETYRQIASDLISGGRLSEEGKKRLQKTQDVLQLGDVAAASAFAAVAAPLLRQEVAKVAETLCGATKASAEELKQMAETLANRRANLGLPVEKGLTIIVDGLRTALRSLYDKACKDARIYGEAKALASMDEMLSFAAEADKVLAELHVDSEEVPQLTLPADSFAARRLYGVYLNRSFSADETAAPPDALSRLLELSEGDEEIARVEICQPRLRELYADSITKAESGGPPLSLAKMGLAAELAKFRLPESAIEEAAMEVYKSRLEAVSGRVLKAHEKQDLDSARNFLGLTETDVRRLHLKAFAETYEVSVAEALGRSGVMNPEAREALLQLRDRLGFTEEDAEKMFYGVIDGKLKDMMEAVREAWEEATYTKEALQKVWKERGKDVGDDPSADGTGGDMAFTEAPQLDGIRGSQLMTELCKVSDYYINNKVVREGKNVLPEDAYPVTVGKWIEDKTKEEMYGIFAWNAVTCQNGAYRDKWQAAKPHVGRILGLNEDQMQKVMVRMVSRWANMFIKQKISENGKLGDEEVSTLTNWVPTFFGIDKDVTKDMVQSANKGVLQSKVLRLINQPKVTPEDVAKLREEVDTWDLALQKDLELTRPQLRSLFRVEVTAMLEDTSKTNAEKQDAIASSRESFGLGDTEAESEMQDLLKARTRGCLVNAVGDLLQGNESMAVQEMQRLELLAEFASSMEGLKLNLDWDVAPSMRKQLVKTYASSPLGDGKANVELLERTLGLVAV